MCLSSPQKAVSAEACNLLRNSKVLMEDQNTQVMLQQPLSSRIRSELSFAQILTWAVPTLPEIKYRFDTGTPVK